MSCSRKFNKSWYWNLGLIDNDNVDLSNIHRQSLYNSKDLKKSKVKIAAKKLKKINPKTKIKTYKIKTE